MLVLDVSCCCLGAWFRVVVAGCCGGFRRVTLGCISCFIGVALCLAWLLYCCRCLGFGLVWGRLCVCLCCYLLVV